MHDYEIMRTICKNVLRSIGVLLYLCQLILAHYIAMLSLISLNYAPRCIETFFIARYSWYVFWYYTVFWCKKVFIRGIVTFVLLWKQIRCFLYLNPGNVECVLIQRFLNRSPWLIPHSMLHIHTEGHTFKYSAVSQ